MLGAAACAFLLAAGAPPQDTLDAILRAQAQEAGVARKVVWQAKTLDPGAVMTATAVVVPPDRLQLFEPGLAPTEHVQIGPKAWIKFGTGPWEDFPFPEALTMSRGPLRADDWSWELRAARATGPRELGGVRCLGYEYTLAAPERTTTVRLWVAEGTGHPRRYEEDGEKDVTSWDLTYDALLTVSPPPGKVAAPQRPARTANVPRITLALASQGLSADPARGRVAVVVDGEGAGLRDQRRAAAAGSLPPELARRAFHAA